MGTIGFFFSFFIIFAVIIMPNIEFFHCSTQWIASKKAAYPHLRHVYALLGNWSYGLFYMMSEIWGSVGISVLFWQFANEIIHSKCAKRIYPVFPFLGNIGQFLAGVSLQYI